MTVQLHPSESAIWESILQMAQQIGRETDPVEQMRQIEQTARTVCHANVRLWLKDQADIASAPQTVQQAFAHDCTIITPAGDKKDTPKHRANKNATTLAIPLKGVEMIMGILYAEAPEEASFTATEQIRLEALARYAAMALEISYREAQKSLRFEQINLMRGVSAQIANIRNPAELYDQVTQLIQQAFGFYYVAIFTLDARSGRLDYRGTAGQTKQAIHPAGFSIALGEGIIGLVGQTGEEIIAPDVHEEPRYRYLDVLPETSSEATLPLKVENRILGVLDIQNDQRMQFEEIDLVILRTLADNIAIAIESAHLYDDLQRRTSQISSVVEVSHILASILDLDELIAAVVELIQRRFGFPFVHVFSVHPGRRLVIFEAGSGERSRSIQKHGLNYHLDSKTGLIPWAARNGRSILANDVANEPLYVPSDLPPLDTRSELCIPLMMGTEVLGVLDLQSTQVNAFDENERALFEALAMPIAIAMRNANLYRSEKWRRKVAESFRDVAHLITTNHPLDEIHRIILEKLEQNLPCDASAIWLYEEDGERNLKLAATRNIAPDIVQRILEEDAEAASMLTRAIDAPSPLIRHPDDPLGPLGAALQLPSTYSSIAAPMRTAGTPLGIITLAHHNDGRYGSESQAITATFASYAAAAIQNARLYRESQEQALVSTMLLQVAEASQTTLTIEDLLNTMIRLARLLMGVRQCAFLLWDDALQNFEMKAWYGFEGIEGLNTRRFSSYLPGMQRLMQEKTTIELHNPAQELDLPEIESAKAPGALLMLPLLVRGEVIGGLIVSLNLAPTDRSGFDPKALGILQGIAHQTALTVDNLHLLEARQEEAYVTAALLQVAQAVVSSNDLHDTLDTIVHLLPILVGIDTCVIYLWDPLNRLFRPIQAYAESRKQQERLLSTSFAPEQHKLLEGVLNKGELHIAEVEAPNTLPENWQNLTALAQPVGADAPHAGHWLLAHPLSMQNMVMGVMLVEEKTTSPAFWNRRLEILNGIAQQVSLAIQNDLLKQEMVDNERIEREVQLARQIQLTFLPTSLPRPPGWELDLRWETAREVGGDFYDVFRLGEKQLGLVVADVSDKGLPAALYMTVARTLIHAYAADRQSPALVLHEVNELLLNDSPQAMFITAIYAILNLETGELIYSNAGHNRPALYRAAEKKVEVLPKGMLAMGIFGDVGYEDHRLIIQPGDALVLYTDGAVDLLSPQNESFGEANLHRVITENGDESIETLLEALDDELTDFRQGIQPFDDVTVLAIRRMPGGIS